MFVKADLLDSFFAERHPSIQHPYILISHNSDVLTDTRHLPRLNEDRIIRWFAQNKATDHAKLQAIPIGLANPCWDHGNLERFQAALSSPPVARDILVYVNFSIGTNQSVRQEWWDYFVRFPGAVVETDVEHGVYLRRLARSRFVVSPPGNGIDCHRTWEALLLGAVPIVQAGGTGLDELFAEAAVMAVRQLSEVTPERLALSHGGGGRHLVEFDHWKEVLFRRWGNRQV